MNKQPLLIAVLGFILGILIEDFLHLFLWLCGGIALFLLVFSCILFSNKVVFHRLRSIFLGLLFLGCGMFSYSVRFFSNESIDFQKKERVIFRLDKKIKSTQKYKRYEVQILKNKKWINAIINIPTQQPELDYQHYYTAQTYLYPISPPLNNYQFDYAHYLERKGIGYQGYLYEPYHKSIKPKLSLRDWLNQKRQNWLLRISASPLGKSTREFLKSIILADRTELDSSTTEDFRKSGIMHLLAISGTHIAIIFEAFLFLLSRFVSRKTSVVMSLILIWFFAVFIGAGSSSVRACLMLSVYAVYQIIQRKQDVLHSLSLAALGILVVSPQQLFDLGFQLSFAAVLGVYWFNRPIKKRFSFSKNRFHRFFISVVALTISAQLGTMPIVLYYFHQYSLIAIVTNIVIIPFAQIIIMFSFVAAILIGLNMGFYVLFYIYDWCIGFMLKGIHFFANIPGAYHSEISMTLLECLSLFVVVYVLRFLILNQSLKNILKFGAVLILFFALRILTDIYYYQKQETIHFSYGREHGLAIKEVGKLYFFVHYTEKADIKKMILPIQIAERMPSYHIYFLPKGTNTIVFNGEKYILQPL
ncbi:competence protein ComEC [Riemerella columbipharyngis]|uniref:Competence protein ComEC n=2 Tax=Riemerella columbipharyngis TaxID=1071918 RepID=A0A1G7D0J6_9FLAO|nr:competence protein ComEC [Riemerella columbipharyngis]